jgi:hypothetical protein
MHQTALRAIACTALALAVTPSGAVVVPTTPANVFGKEYTDRVDINAKSKAEPLRELDWNGRGAVVDGPRFDKFPRGTNIAALDVDGLAYHEDFLYMQVVQDRATLIFALAGDKFYRYRMDTRNGKGSGIWATEKQINAGGVTRVDDLDLHGGNGDADRFSLVGDPAGVAIWAPPSEAGKSNSLQVTTRQIGKAIGLADKYLPMLDVDAFMFWQPVGVKTPMPSASDKEAIKGKDKLGLDDSEPADFEDLEGGPPQELDAIPPDPALAAELPALRPRLLFSVAPITDGQNVVLDGGEIWEWDMSDRNVNAAKYLTHGGITWSTSFEVAKTFCGKDAAKCSEDVVALEAVGTAAAAAVPEPGTWATMLGGLAIGAVLLRGRIRRASGAV